MVALCGEESGPKRRTIASAMVRDERGRFVELTPYAGCPVFERHGDCNCSTGCGFGAKAPTMADERGVRPRLLDLFCGGGGAAMGYHRAGFDVVGVDLANQPNYPFEFVQADALDVLANLDGNSARYSLARTMFDAIHASPPCEFYSTITPTDRREDHPDLISPVRELLGKTGLPWVMENVQGAPLLTGFVLCGSMFGLRVRRHRLFESNRLFMPPVCRHAEQGTALGVYGNGGGGKSTRPSGGGGTKAARSEFGTLMEMDWATPKEIVKAIPPAYTTWIGERLIESLAPHPLLYPERPR